MLNKLELERRKDISPHQKLILNYFREKKQSGEYPTLKQASKDLSITPAGVYKHLKILDKFGYIKYVRGVVII